MQATDFSLSKSGDLLDYTCAERLLRGQKGRRPRDTPPKHFCGTIYSSLEYMHTHGRKILRYTKYRL